MPKAPQTKNLLRDKLLDEADELYNAYSARRTADNLLEDVFSKSKFTGKLWAALGVDVQNSKMSELIINFLRAAVIDRTTMLAMLPDPKFSVPFMPDPDIALAEQDVLINTHKTLWDYWRIKRVYNVQGFNISLKNRCLWALFPDFTKRKPMLYALNPSVFYAEPDYRGDYPRVFLIQEETG